MTIDRINGMLRTRPLSSVQQANSVLNVAEYNSGATELRSAPRRILFEMTNRCNYRCIMCGRNFNNFHFSDMDKGVITAFAPLYELIEEVTLFGWGESMLHKQFDEILTYLHGFPWLRKFLLTNGSLPERTAHYVREGRLDILSISMDGATPQTLERIRSGAKMDVIRKTVTGVSRLVRDGRPHLNLVFLLFNSNIHELPLMPRICAEWGVPELKVIYLTAFDDTLAQETMWSNDGSYKEYFAKTREQADRFGIALRLPDCIGESPAKEAAHKPCDTAWKDLFVSCDQTIRPCMSTNEILTSLKGRPLETLADFFDIWNCQAFKEFRAAVNNKKTMSRACQHCYQCSYANWNKRYAHIATEFTSPFSANTDNN